MGNSPTNLPIITLIANVKENYFDSTVELSRNFFYKRVLGKCHTIIEMKMVGIIHTTARITMIIRILKPELYKVKSYRDQGYL